METRNGTKQKIGRENRGEGRKKRYRDGKKKSKERRKK
jgi:hypothetical protein